jgi:hypothetical protein
MELSIDEAIQTLQDLLYTDSKDHFFWYEETAAIRMGIQALKIYKGFLNTVDDVIELSTSEIEGDGQYIARL